MAKLLVRLPHTMSLHNASEKGELAEVRAAFEMGEDLKAKNNGIFIIHEHSNYL